MSDKDKPTPGLRSSGLLLVQKRSLAGVSKIKPPSSSKPSSPKPAETQKGDK